MKKHPITILLLFLHSLAITQSLEVDYRSWSNIGIINGELKGKDNKIEGHYVIAHNKSTLTQWIADFRILDTNLNTKHSIVLEYDKATSIIEVAFNGEFFALLIDYSSSSPISQATKETTIQLYNKELKFITEKKLSKHFQFDRPIASYQYHTHIFINNNYALIPDSIGFTLYYSDQTNGKDSASWHLTKINNSGVTLWTTAKSKNHLPQNTNNLHWYREFFLCNNGKNIISSIEWRTKDKKSLSKYGISVRNSQNGFHLFNYFLDNTTFHHRLEHACIVNDSIFLVCQFYKYESEKSIKFEAQGLAVLILDNTGKLISKNHYSWQDLSMPIKSTENQFKMQELDYIKIRGLVTAQNDEIFILGDKIEQKKPNYINPYSNQANALCIFKFTSNLKHKQSVLINTTLNNFSQEDLIKLKLNKIEHNETIFTHTHFKYEKNNLRLSLLERSLTEPVYKITVIDLYGDSILKRGTSTLFLGGNGTGVLFNTASPKKYLFFDQNFSFPTDKNTAPSANFSSIFKIISIE